MESIVVKFISYIDVELNYSVHTIRNYKKDLELFSVFLKENKINYSEIDYSHIRLYLNNLYEKKYESKTINRMLSSLRSFFKYLKKEKLIKTNPMELITNNKVSKKIPNYLHYYEFEKLLNVPDDSALGLRDKVILETLYSTGIRVSELVNIKADDIYLEDGLIKVMGKGRKERFVIFGNRLRETLKFYLQTRSNLITTESDTLLLNKNGKPLTDRGVRLIIEKIAKKTDIQKPISPHTLRHTFATHMLDAGADLKIVQELLGHESIGSTGIYTHVSNEKLRDEYRKNHPRAKKE